MISVWPAFAADFACKAGTCRHTCCRGWEIDIDPETYRLYSRMPGDLGMRLRSCTEKTETGGAFVLTPDERCPFLQPDGLCELIRRGGETLLCEICRMHPRFFGCLGETELCGLGLSCEKTAELLCGLHAPLSFYEEATGVPLSLDALLHDPRYLGLPAEVYARAALRFTPEPTPRRHSALFAAMGQTEPINDGFCRFLAACAASPEATAARARQYCSRYDPTVYDNLLAYILYRALPLLGAYPAQALLQFARDGAEFAFLCAAADGNDAEAMRMWSEQIEYSDENTNRLLDRLCCSPAP